MAELGLQFIQKELKEHVMAIQDENAEGDNKLDPWHGYFQRQFSNLSTRVGKIKNHKM